ncbi:MAG: hypothetical protein U9P10_08160 [Thermodesulfobacteriota bacterium]|nr:hypothetical protein [Thermodesulfobacteriota bacterium]
MNGLYYRIWKNFLVLMCCGLLCTAGCTRSSNSSGKNEFLLKCRDKIISVDEFSEEIEMKKAGYPYAIKHDPEAFCRLMADLVDQLAEELVIRVAAEDRGYIVSDKDMDALEKDIKKEYPGNSFDAMLIENAVSYDFWRKRLKIELVMKQFIKKALTEKIEVTPGEITRYFKQYQKKETSRGEGQDTGPEEMNETDLIDSLRQAKAEKMYPEWFASLEQQYPVTINHKSLEAFLKK